MDAVAIPAGLGLDARIESACLECGAPVSVTLGDGVVTAAPATAVIWAVDVEERQEIPPPT